MSDSVSNTNNSQLAGDNSSPEEHATTMRPSIKEHRELLVAFFILAVLAFLVNGAGDLIQGPLSFAKLYGIAGLLASPVERFIPATYVAGRLMTQKAMQGQTVRLENIPYLLPNGKYGLTTETFIPLRAEPETENENTFTSILPKQERRIADAQLKAHIAC